MYSISIQTSSIHLDKKSKLSQRKIEFATQMTAFEKGYTTGTEIGVEYIRLPMWKATAFHDVTKVQVISPTEQNVKHNLFTVMCFKDTGPMRNMILKLGADDIIKPKKRFIVTNVDSMVLKQMAKVLGYSAIELKRMGL